MKKVVKIGAWYMAFTPIIFWLYFTNRMPRPLCYWLPFPSRLSMFSQHRADRLTDAPYIFGDCSAYYEPLRCRRYAIPFMRLDDAKAHIAKIPCEDPQNVRATIVIELGGADLGRYTLADLDERVNDIALDVQHRFPNSKVICIPPSVISSIAQRHGRDGDYRYKWHLNQAGYRFLHHLYLS